jgi:predicted TIM-barrel fold metal-dependent hydrolase
MVIDFRVQPPYGSLLDLHFFRPRPDEEDPVHGNPFVVDRETPPSFTHSSMDSFIDEMDEAGIDHAVIMGQRAATRWGNASNEDIAQLVADHPGRFTGFAGIDASSDALEEARRACDGLGLSGIALVPGWSDPPVVDDDDRLMPLYEWCAERGIPVSVTASHFIGPDMLHAHPVHIQRVALAFPELKLIVAHGGWPWTTAAVALAMRSTNVYLMPDFYLYLPHMPGARDYVDAANGFLKHRMLYSSCYPSNSLRNALAHLGKLSLSDDAREHLVWRNARRLLDTLE